VLEAAFWGLVGASTLIVGAVLALALPWTRRAIGLIAGFGAGALISAVTLDLTASAFAEAHVAIVVAGLGAGAIAFSAGNWALHRGGAVRHRKRSAGQQAGADPLGIVLGTILDGIPESVVIGISLLAGGGVGLAFLAAVAISNLPEAISSTTGLRRVGWSTRGIMGLWVIVVGLSGLRARCRGADRGRGGDRGVRRGRGAHDAGRHDDAGGVRRGGCGRGAGHGPGLRDRGAADARVVRRGTMPPWT
jgi:ZIP family zinc transporter